MYRRLMALIGLLIVGLLIASPLPFSRREGWTDAISGTTRWETTWPLGIKTGVRTDTSVLDTKLHALGYQWTPIWRTVNYSKYNAWGRMVEVDDSDVPEIIRMDQLLDWYVKIASPDELRRFADVMRTGTDDQQKAAVDAASQKALAAFDAEVGCK